ncbi:hypothetical protein FA15DRAFT_664579 [Coprinopsis marcescibilis]|uniref:RRM domain-containing protein n=1 Tax=Coprinopsis marcescibilis TaxID=230819 RepID=A0A5C3L7E9_COPMA|nr:hypothetical protein FA15DRAFT_664579 [Coprinopsis marcescibilis]
MSSSEASSSSSRSSSSPESIIKKALKRKRTQKAPANLDSGDSDSGSSGSSSGAASDDDSDASDSENAMEVDGDTPALSHAERRKQKKRALKTVDTKTEDSDAPTKKRKLKDGSAAPAAESSAQAKRQNSVWVGNMSFKTTQENLKTFFKECGEITRVHLPMKALARPNLPQENRGFAYVDFATPEANTAAIALSEKPLLGRKLLIKDGGDFSGRPIAPGVDVKTTDSALAQKTHSKTAQKILRNQKQQPAPTLFLGNLPFETTEGDIRGLFEAHRPVKKPVNEKEPSQKEPFKKKESEEETDAAADKEVEAKTSKDKQDDFILKIRMGTFEDSGACKGFAFVDFSSIDNATSALINPRNHHFNGRDLKVEYAGADAVRRGAAKHLLPAGTGKKGDGISSGRPRTGGPRPNAGGRGGAGGRERRDLDRSDKPRTGYTRGGADPAGDDVAAAVDAAMQAVGGVGSPSKAFNTDSREGSDRKKGGGKEHKGPRQRPKPGAALAQAKRETFAIIPSEGKKITF